MPHAPTLLRLAHTFPGLGSSSQNSPPEPLIMFVLVWWWGGGVYALYTSFPLTVVAIWDPTLAKTTNFGAETDSVNPVV